MRTDPSSGRADVAALVLSLLLGAAALAPTLLVRRSPGFEKSRGDALAGPAAAAPVNPVAGPLAAAAGARTLVATSVFRVDPTRLPGPPPGPASEAPAAAVRGLSGRVAEGRLYLLWRAVPGSSSTLLRVEGLGGTAALEREFPAAVEAAEFPVTAAAGTLHVRATPAGLPGRVAEARTTIPFRIPVEPARAAAASPATGSALLVLRRPFDGRTLEGEFPLREADVVGGLASAGPGGPVVEFRTDFVIEAIREGPPTGEGIPVPVFTPEGRVARDEGGAPLVSRIEAAGPAPAEVVLRGPDDRRVVLRVGGGGR